MSFNGNEGEQISLEEGAGYTARYRANHPDSIIGTFVGKNHVSAILAQSDCHGLRVYLGENAQGGLEFVFVGADSNGNDMLDLIVERTFKCPTFCGGSNPLNSNLISGSK
ncbi:hypothetical protein D3C87_10700 [compost metagenome]